MLNVFLCGTAFSSSFFQLGGSKTSFSWTTSLSPVARSLNIHGCPTYVLTSTHWLGPSVLYFIPTPSWFNHTTSTRLIVQLRNLTKEWTIERPDLSLFPWLLWTSASPEYLLGISHTSWFILQRANSWTSISTLHHKIEDKIYKLTHNVILNNPTCRFTKCVRSKPLQAKSRSCTLECLEHLINH